VPYVQYRTPDDGQRDCPKQVEILDKNNFEEISLSVGFIKKEICHAARSHVTMHGHMSRCTVT